MNVNAQQLNEQLNKRLTLYFKLTIFQRRLLSSMGFSSVTLERLGYDNFCKITKSKQLRKDYRAIVASTDSTTNVIYTDFTTPVRDFPANHMADVIRVDFKARCRV